MLTATFKHQERQPMQQLLLSLSLRFGPSTAALGNLLRQCGSLDFLKENGDLIALYQPNKGKHRLQELNQWWQWLRQSDWKIISLNDAEYPTLLKCLPDAPGLLYARGNLSLLNSPQLAMVGARNASPEGLMHAERFAKELSAYGFTITSGLALGIDAKAHQGALAQGATIAVLPCGPNFIYPNRHQYLAEQIIQSGGLIISEFPPNTPARKPYFPLRNRIISGLSLATLVIEAALPSGTLVTAKHALEQGRDVFAMPGAIHNPMSRGCHYLLRDGAQWLESSQDVLKQLAELVPLTQVSTTELTAVTKENPLLKHFVSGINHFDSLLERTGMQVNELNIALAELELSGKIQRIAGGYSRC